MQPNLFVHLHNSAPGAFPLDLLVLGVYTFSPGAAGAVSIYDPLEGTETTMLVLAR